MMHKEYQRVVIRGKGVWRSLIPMLAVTVIVALSATAGAQPRAAFDNNRGQGETDPSELLYRQFRIPADNVAPFVAGLRPRSQAEFEELVRNRPRTDVAFASAEYQATWADDGELRGTCRMQRGAIPAGSSRYLILGGGMAMGETYWMLGDERRPALLGRSDRTLLLMDDPTSDQFHFAWKLRGERDAGTTTFSIELPNALTHKLSVDLPRSMELRSAGNVVAVFGEAGVENRRWTVRSSGQRELILEVREFERDSMLRLDVRSDGTYLVRDSDVRFTGLFTFSKPHAGLPPDTIELNMDSGLSVTSVTSGGAPVEWTVSSQRPNVCNVRFPDWQGRSESTLQVEAITRFPRGELFELPRIRSKANWTNESTRLVVQHPMEVADLRLSRCRCEQIERLGDLSESMVLVMSDEDAEATLLLDRKPYEIEADALVDVTLEEPLGVTADVELQFNVLGDRELFELGFELEPGWDLPKDSMDAIADTNLLGLPESILDRQLLDGNGRQWSVRLKKTADKLRLRFRLQNPDYRDGASLSELVPFRFPQLDRLDAWVYVRDMPGYDLVTEGAHFGAWQKPDVDPSEPIPEWIRERLAIDNSLQLASRNLFGKYSPGARLVKLNRRAREALPRMQSTTSVVVGASTTTQTFDMLIDPLGNETESLNVVFSQPLPTDGLLTLDDRTKSPVMQKIESRSTDPPNWTRYKVTLDPVSEPFHLRYSYSMPSTEQFSLPMMVMEADGIERGKVGVYAEGAVGVKLTSTVGLTPMPFPMLEQTAVEARNLRAAFSYDDKSTTLPELTIQQERLSVPNTLTAWRCDVRSFFAEKGRPRHRVDYYLQNDGASRIQLSLATGTALEFVEIDGEPVVPQPRLMNGLLTIPLPAGRPYPSVSVRFVEPEESLSAIDWLLPPVPDSNVEAFQTTWQLWLPGDYRAYEPANSTDDGWRRRWFGEFGSDSGPRFGRAAIQSLRRRLVPGLDRFTFLVEQTERLLGPNRLTGSAQPESLTWGSRLADIERAMAGSQDNFSLLIDREELRRIGVFPETPLPKTRNTSSFINMGQDRLARSGVGLVVDGSTIVVTSSAEVREQARGSELMNGIAVEGSTSWFAATRLQQIEPWRSGDTDGLWRPSADALETGLQNGGWKSRRLTIDGPPTAIKIYHRDTATAIACSVFFLAIAIGAWLVQRLRRWMVVVLVGLIVALLLPRPGATMAGAFAWGMALSGLGHLVFSGRRHRPPRPSQRFVSLTATRAASWVLFVIIVVAAADVANGQDGTVPTPDAISPNTSVANTGNSTGTRASVYVPVDENDEPTGVIYIDDEFYRQLVERDDSNRLEPTHLFQSAIYWADFSRSDQSDASQLRVEFTVTTFADRVRIPLPAFGGAELNIDSIRLNRETPKLETLPSGELAIIAGNPGDYRVDLELQVQLGGGIGEQRLNCPIPPLPVAQLNLQVPRGRKDIVVASATGGVTGDPTRGTLVADLGAADSIDILAPSLSRRDSGQEAEQLVLVTVEEDRIEMEYRFVTGDDFSPLTLYVDDGLVPLPESIESMEWNAETRILNTEILASSQGIRFLAARPNSPGSFRIPRVRVLNVAIEKTTFAVVASDELLVAADRVMAEQGDVDDEEFTENWTGLSVTPDLLLRTIDELPLLQIRRQPAEETWESEIAFLFDAMQTRYEATLQYSLDSELPTTVAIQRFRIPTGMPVDDVLASSSAGVPLRLRWRRHSDELIVFFLDQPQVFANHPVDIRFMGTLTPQDGMRDLPLILPTVETGVSQSLTQKIVLYRSASVELEADPLATVTLNMDQAESTERNGYRYFCSWTGEVAITDDIEPAAFGVVKQQSTRTLTGEMTCELRHDEAGWSVDIEVTVESSDGILDAIHFDLPVSLVGNKPSAFEEDTELRVGDIQGGPGIDRRNVTVWLPERNASRNTPRTIVLSARLDQEQTRLPIVRLLNVDIVENNGQRQQFVELPSRSTNSSDTSKFNWTRRGLSELSFDSNTGLTRHRVTLEDYAALLKEVQAGVRAEVTLLDTLVAWRSPESYLAISRFDLKPADRSDVIIRLPPDAELLQLVTDGTPASYRPVTTPSGNDRGAYRISVPQSPWPQRIRAIYRGSADSGFGGQVKLQAPRLLTTRDEDMPTEIPITNEVWTVHAPATRGPGMIADPEFEQVDEATMNRTLMSAFATLWNNSQVNLREKQREEQLAWLASWSMRMEEVFGLLAEQEDDGSDDPELETLRQLMDDFPEVFQPELYGRTDLVPNQVRTQDLWSESQWLSGQLLRCVRDRDTNVASRSSNHTGAANFPALKLRYPRQSTSRTRYFMAGLVIFVAAALTRWRPSPVWKTWAARYPHAVAIAIGLMWWLFLTPAWIGVCFSTVVGLIWLEGVVRRRRLMLPG